MTSNHEDISEAYCQCSVCSVQQPSTVQHHEYHPQVGAENCLLNFVELLPKNFPLAIIPTASPKTKAFYFNKFGNRLFIIPFTKITEHFPLATNIVLFYPNKASVAHKYELIKEDSTFTYLQAHYSHIPHILDYRVDEKFMDEVLSEKFTTLVRSISKNENYELTNNERDFLTWVHKDYGDTIFCKYMTTFYCALIEIFRKDVIVSGKFEWIIEKPGAIKLSNVKDLVIKKNKRCATFQQQYEQKILEKLNVRQPIESKLFSALVQKSKINFRINNFRNQIRQIFNHEKLKILKNTQKERTVETKTLSDDVARLFLPQLHKFTSLREVLNDQVKFKKVVLGIDEGLKQKKVGQKFHRVKESSLLREKSKSKGRHYRSKTQV